MAKTATKKTAEVSQPDTVNQAQTDASTNIVPESINLSDLALLLQIVDLATQRGAFRGAELSQVGNVFDKLNAFLSYIQAQQQASSTETTEDQ
jgi:hypothetical protein